MAELNLPAAERDVLACLHQHGQATARDLRESLDSYRPMAHGSVLTLLKRLEAKGLVAKEKGPIGKAFVYRACQQPRTTFRGIIKQLMNRVFHGDSVALMASVFDTKPPTAEEVEKMQKMLDELKAKKERRK
jgi:BlaI family transcriptional regulator, penicillinase repressor